MRELRVAPAPGLPQGLVIPAAELAEQFTHASGPGGQGVNTADSRVQLSYDIAASIALTDIQRARLLARLGSRLSGTVLTVVAAEFRSQRRNRVTARDRLAALLSGGLAPPSPPRRATRPTRSSVDRRLAGKRHRAQTKQARRPPADD